MDASKIKYGSPEWEQACADEVASRPTASPIEGRHFFTPQELQDIRDGKPEALAKIRTNKQPARVIGRV